MRHLKKGRKFGRKTGQRRAFIKSLANNLIFKEKIETTEARGKEIKSVLEKFVTLAKKKNLASFRIISSRLSNKKAASKLFYDIAPRYAERKGGYLRATKMSKARKKDGTKMILVEFI